MTVVKPERPFIRITDDTTRAELIECIRLLNDNAKRIHRRGYQGVASAEYALAHERIDAVLADLASCR